MVSDSSHLTAVPVYRHPPDTARAEVLCFSFLRPSNYSGVLLVGSELDESLEASSANTISISNEFTPPGVESIQLPHIYTSHET